MRILAISTALALLAPAVLPASPLSDRIAETNPCADLPQIDRTDFVRIDAASLLLDGDMLAASASGALGCKTSDAALVPLDASMSVSVAARVSIAECLPADVSATLSDFGGTLGPALEAAAPLLEVEIVEAVSEEVAALCAELVGS